MREALFYERDESGNVFCHLCPVRCKIREGKTGRCRARKNESGVLYLLNYGECAAIALDPVEKKPLYHFYPGYDILSLGTFGCNFHCVFCQNWQLAHGDPPTRYLGPGDIAGLAEKYSAENCVGVAYTYAEPLVWYEFIYDTSKAVKEKGFVNVLVTNGYINPEPLNELLPYIDAMNIDLKAFTDEFYRENCSGRLEPVMCTVEQAAQKCHVELTTLLIPGLNDSQEEINEMVEWIAGVDPSIPLHFSRYFPQYKMDRKPTPLETLEQARETALKKLDYVYIGNAPQLKGGSDTVCPSCGEVVISRTGFTPSVKGLDGNKCTYCGKELNIVTA